MCWEIEFKGKTAETIGDLVKLIGRENIIPEKGYSLAALVDDGCLCPIDEAATARKVGYKAVLNYPSNVIHFKEVI